MTEEVSKLIFVPFWVTLCIVLFLDKLVAQLGVGWSHLVSLTCLVVGLLLARVLLWPLIF